MWIDKQLLLANNQAPTSTGDTDTENVIDLVKRGGANDELIAIVLVTETVTSSDAATVQFTLKHSQNGSSWTTIASTASIAKADLTAGTVMLAIRLPKELYRYIKGTFTIGKAALTAGKFYVALVKDVQTNVVPVAY